jgi:hypothetical protein
LFSNLKRGGPGVYHGLRKTNLQHYLDEFVFRFNRRRTRHAAFDTLLGIGARRSVLVAAFPFPGKRIQPRS